MKKLILMLGFIATCSVYAQTGTNKTGSLLWKISGKDLTQPSYLLGTLHFKSGEYLDSIAGAREALQSCEQVVVELNMTDMANLQLQLLQAMAMPSDTTYKMLYSKKDYKFVNKQLVSLIGVGLEQLGMMKPAALELTLTGIIYAKHFPDADPANVLDVRIQTEAENEQKDVVSLETIDDQIYVLFDVMSLQRQADVLLCELKNMNKMAAMTDELINDYNRGNLDKLYLQLNSDICPYLPSEKNSLVKNRNEAWIKILPEIMKENSSFIAVGALHLAGEEGLLNLLEKAGYKIEPVVL